RNRELVGVRGAGLDGWLGKERHAILVIGNIQNVEVDCRGFIQVVVNENANTVALASADLGPWHLLVEGPCLHELSRPGLPLHLGDGEFEDLYTVLNARLEKLAAFSLSGRGEGLYALLVHAVHLLGLRNRGARGHGWVCGHGAAALVAIGRNRGGRPAALGPGLGLAAQCGNGWNGERGNCRASEKAPASCGFVEQLDRAARILIVV